MNTTYRVYVRYTNVLHNGPGPAPEVEVREFDMPALAKLDRVLKKALSIGREARFPYYANRIQIFKLESGQFRIL